MLFVNIKFMGNGYSPGEMWLGYTKGYLRGHRRQIEVGIKVCRLMFAWKMHRIRVAIIESRKKNIVMKLCLFSVFLQEIDNTDVLNELCFWTLSIVWCLKKTNKIEELKIWTKYHNTRWIKSKSTIRSILTHHRQNPTEINKDVAFKVQQNSSPYVNRISVDVHEFRIFREFVKDSICYSHQSRSLGVIKRQFWDWNSVYYFN
jgi:hypothetical protein